jgi:ESCRT-II complex subunit VPS25
MASGTEAVETGSTFTWPREYSFPPFFTRQTNLTTLHAQLTKWSALVLSYCAYHRIFKLSLSEAAGTATSATAVSILSGLHSAEETQHANVEELFHNRRLHRRLSYADIREVMDFMRKEGRVEYVSSSGSSGSAGAGGDVVWVYWRTPEEWAGLVERWVEETAQKGTVLTLYELTQGEGVRGTGELLEAPGVLLVVFADARADFYGLDPDLLQKALSILVKRGKAQIFGQEDSLGVKFF